jgi:MerR family transcriptional regulator, copper efflux regulator
MKQTTSTQQLVQIGVLAERVGLSLRTVRYYEEIGLLLPDSRSAGGFRLYAPEQEDRLRLLKTMKPLGFTLEEMRTLIAMLDDAARARPGSQRAARLLRQIDALRQEIAVRRGALLDQVKATEQITSALNVAAQGLS